MTTAENERLYGYLEGGGRAILSEPEAILTRASKLPGLDGEKMSKSYRNTILLRDDPQRVEKEVRAMPTDPARVRRNDPGDPEKCPVWDLHKVYSSDDTRTWVEQGCRSAPFIEDRTLVRNIIADGCEKARETADETMEQVRSSMNLDYY